MTTIAARPFPLKRGPDVLASELSSESHETCCTYNMLRLTREPPEDVRLVPFHTLFGKRYAIYWTIGRKD